MCSSPFGMCARCWYSTCSSSCTRSRIPLTIRMACVKAFGVDILVFIAKCFFHFSRRIFNFITLVVCVLDKWRVKIRRVHRCGARNYGNFWICKNKPYVLVVVTVAGEQWQFIKIKNPNALFFVMPKNYVNYATTIFHTSHLWRLAKRIMIAAFENGRLILLIALDIGTIVFICRFAAIIRAHEAVRDNCVVQWSNPSYIPPWPTIMIPSQIKTKKKMRFCGYDLPK